MAEDVEEEEEETNNEHKIFVHLKTFLCTYISSLFHMFCVVEGSLDPLSLGLSTSQLNKFVSRF